MELSKVLDGFTVADTLVIKAQVQVIHEKPARPFRCLEPQYRRELVRVYLTNVEGICRRFLEGSERRSPSSKRTRRSGATCANFCSPPTARLRLRWRSRRRDTLLKGIVKRFFNEKEVTSTLVMDALYCGCRALDVGNATPAEAAKTFKPGRSVWLSIAQNKVRHAPAHEVSRFSAVFGESSTAFPRLVGVSLVAMRDFAFFVLTRRY